MPLKSLAAPLNIFDRFCVAQNVIYKRIFLFLAHFLLFFSVCRMRNTLGMRVIMGGKKKVSKAQHPRINVKYSAITHILRKMLQNVLLIISFTLTLQ